MAGRFRFVQQTQNTPVQFFVKFKAQKLLNMNIKPDKEFENRGDDAFLFELIANCIYWQNL